MALHGNNARAELDRFADVHGCPGGILPEHCRPWKITIYRRTRSAIKRAKGRGLDGYWSCLSDSSAYSATRRYAAGGDWQAKRLVQRACDLYAALRREAEGEPDGCGAVDADAAVDRQSVVAGTAG